MLEQLKDIAHHIRRETAQAKQAAHPKHRTPKRAKSLCALVTQGEAETEALTRDLTRLTAPRVSPGLADAIHTYTKICTVLEVLCFNGLNQALLSKVRAPQFLILNLLQVLDALEGYDEQAAKLRTQLIATTLKCLGASLRCHQSILDFLKHPDRLLLRTI